MAPQNFDAKNKKRKHSEPEQALPSAVGGQGQLEMFSDEEDDKQFESDDGHVDTFPEILTEDESEEIEERDSPLAGEDDESEGSSKSGEDVESEEDEDSETESDGSIHIFPKSKLITSEITGQPKRVFPEIEPDYDSDSSTEDAPNRVGNIPMHWYDDLPHIGYDIDGKKVLRPAHGDELDKFLKTVEDPSAWTSAYDKNTQANKPLTPEELDIIRRLYEGENPDANYDPYEPTIEWFTGKGKEEVMPLSAAPEPKRRFIPSKWEKQKVMKIVRAIRQGRILAHKPKATAKFDFYSIWSETPSSVQPPPLPAPKPPLPTNSESYNPPAEYLPTEEERKKWEEADPEDREQDYLPQKYTALRLVPAYDRFIKERFNRQLDLYLAPRVQRVKLNIDPSALIPKLPSPSSLKPYPNYKSLRFLHPSPARCISISPDGAWVVSGDESGTVSLWEVSIGREIKRWKFDGKIGSVDWCPRLDASYFVVGVDEALHFIVPPHLSHTVLSTTQSILAPAGLPPTPSTPSPVKWMSTTSWSVDKPILTLILPPSSGLPTQVTWHRKGDYLATVSNENNQGGVWIHQVTRRHSQAPFKRIKGSVQAVLFHPLKPHFFVATQRYVRIYNLAEQKLLKTLTPGIRWISSIDVHPSGDHLIVGGYDRKLCWFDLELSEKPYKVLRYTHSPSTYNIL
ncbi:hypothetical protein AX16_000209 [Volvariella volvacea WC 439]|nr:hypothetical protein AX16_000209 [Volvariella volvacea WC 439]